MEVPLENYLILSAILFFIGVVAVMVRRNAIVLLMGVELMLNSANLVFLAFSRVHHSNDGHVFVFVVIAVAAAEAAVGLAIVLNIYRHRRTINVDEANAMKF